MATLQELVEQMRETMNLFNADESRKFNNVNRIIKIEDLL